MSLVTEVYWHLSDYCNQACEYCPPRYRGGNSLRPTEQYLSVIEKIQNSRYKFASNIVWQLGGGEPLSMPDLPVLLQKIKQRSSTVCIETAGGNSWFDYMSIQEYIDQITFTYHHWQNISVAEYIIDFCQTNNKILNIKVPFYPGKVKDQLALISDLQSRGITVEGHALSLDARPGYELISGYSAGEINLMFGRPEDWVPPPPPPIDPNAPDPNWVDPNLDDGSPKNLGYTCYAGVDYLYISHQGYVSGSDCGGRSGGNVYDADWQPYDAPFSCPMFFCKSDQDKRRIRINK